MLLNGAEARHLASRRGECRHLTAQTQPCGGRSATGEGACRQNERMDSATVLDLALAIQPDDLADIEWVSDVDVTPDGTRVAYTQSRLSLDRDETVTSIWVVDITSPGEASKFTAGIRRDTNPRWSPDGRQLAFLSERPCPDLTGAGADRPQLYVMAATGGEARRVTSAPGGVVQFAWAPDATRLAFIARVPTTEPEVVKASVVGDRSPSKPFRVIDSLKYRRNGEGFIDSRRHLFIVGAGDGGNAVQITDGDFDHSDPAWSPDGSRVVFVTARHNSRDTDNAQSIVVTDVSRHGGGKDHTYASFTFVRAVGPCAFPTWSPDGSQIAFAGHAYRTDTGRHTRVWVVSASGGQAEAVADPLDRNVAASSGARPTWTKDGKSILFTVETDGSTILVEAPRPDLWIVGGSDTLRIVIGGRREVSTFAAPAGADCIAAVLSTAGQLPAVHVVRREDGVWNETSLSDPNSIWRQSRSVGAVYRFTVERPLGPITVWVHLPPAADVAAPRSVPVLVNIHGGPHAQYGDRFFDEFAVYTGAGYAVVFTNPHGSTGRSEAFTRSVRGDWGGIDAADVLAAVDAALAAVPCLDPDRMGLMGGSYGGYLTSWIAAHDHRFRAACSERAVNDFSSFAGTSDIGFWFAEGQLGASPYDDPALAAKHSPLTYAAAIQTPLLIMHAEQDYRCPIEQAERLFVALARRGHPVRFVRVPDADHELSRSGRPRQRIERFRHILDWFGRYLKAPVGDEPHRF